MGGMPGNIYTPANQRPMRPSSKEGSGGVHIRQELPSPMQVKKNLVAYLRRYSRLFY